jgi:uncharacterized protein
MRSVLAEAFASATSRIAYPECHAALARARREGRISLPEQRRVTRALDLRWEELLIVEFDHELAGSAARLVWERPLRAGDAIHLASAIRLASAQDGLHFACFDRRLWNAAAALGFQMVPGTAP